MRRQRIITIALVAVCGAAGLGSAYTWTRGTGAGSVVSRSEAGPRLETLRVVLGVQPTRKHDIGEVTRGGRIEVPFVVFNPGSMPVTVGPIRTSCDCLRVELYATRVQAGAEVSGRAVIDLAGAPKFAGGLMLEAVAAAVEDGQPVFALKLSVEVK